MINLELTLEDITTLEEQQVIAKQEEQEDSQDNASLYRIAEWTTKCDCAIITAWRSSKSRQENDDNNRKLQTSLRQFGYGVIKVRGCYAEIGAETQKENSFFVVDLTERPDVFFDDLYNLSADYEQDCFLHKAAGKYTDAYLIGTNDDFGMGKRKIAGKMRIGLIRPGAYSEIGSGRIIFE